MEKIRNSDDFADAMELDTIIRIVNSSSLEKFSYYYQTLESSEVNLDYTNELGDEDKETNSIIDVSQEKQLDQENQPLTIDFHDLISLSSETFSCREDLIGSVRAIVLRHGYATTIKRSKANRYVIIGCDRGGKYRRAHIPIEQRKKITSSRLINCPFEVWGKKKVDGFWKVEVKNLQHNHEPSSDMSGHPSCRRFSKEEIQHVREMSKAGIPPRQILASLRQGNPNLQAISRTIYNAKAKIRKENLMGRTAIQALFDEFVEIGFVYDIEHDDKGHLTHLFFAHPFSIILTKSYSTIFVMDCTYKINRYKMPLLEIIGVSSFNTSFYSCFVAMQKEEESDYIWALERFKKLLGVGKNPSVIVTDRELALMNAIEIVFPSTTNLLCVWHIEKNILSKCKKYFEEKEAWETFILSWTNLIKSTYEITLLEGWKLLEVDQKEQPLVLNYLENTWLPFKEKFIYAWTDKHLHFGNHNSSRAEGAHSMLKTYLQVSTGDFHEVKQKICLAIEIQYQEIKARLESERLRIPHGFHIPLFQKLISHVSVYALGQIFKQHELASRDGPLPCCKGHFQSSMGLPCAHMIREMWTLELVYIHPQWRIDSRSFSCIDGTLEDEDAQIRPLLNKVEGKYQGMSLRQKEDTRRKLSQLINGSSSLIHEPKVSSHKGRPTNSKKEEGSCTRRDPSAFELVEKSRKCSICHGVGHNSRTCPDRDGRTM